MGQEKAGVVRNNTFVYTVSKCLQRYGQRLEVVSHMHAVVYKHREQQVKGHEASMLGMFWD